MAEELSSPLGKVLELLDDLSNKLTTDGEEADKAYREYASWCDDTASTKRLEIKTATTKQEKLTATIDKLSSLAAVASGRVEELGKNLATEQKQLKDAVTIREKEAKEYTENEAELMDTIDTIARAVAVIEKEMEKNKAAFTQVDTKNFKKVMHTLSLVVDAAGFSVAGKQKLLALVQSQQQTSDESADMDEDRSSDDDQLQAPSAPAPAAYESRSGSIVDLLEDLKEKADDELQELRSAESNGKHNFQMLHQSLKESMANGEKDMGDAKAAMAKAEEEMAAAKGELADNTKLLNEANKRLDEVKRVCMQTAGDHESSVRSRKEELAVMQQAKKTLQEATSPAAASFLQVASNTRQQSASRARTSMRTRTRADVQRAEVLSVVNRLARNTGSTELTQLASRIDAVLKLGGVGRYDPFEKIRGMIADLITKLEAEASAEAEEKAYCDDEMAKTKEKKNELEEDLDQLTAKMDKAAAKSTSLKGEVKELQKELASIAKLQAEADQVRRDAKAAYEKEKAELEKALEGVRRALSVLRQYFGQSEAASMLQRSSDLADFMRQPSPPKSFDKSEGAGSAIVGVLEVCESDFAKELAKISTEEEERRDSYEDMTQANKEDSAMKVKAVQYKVKSFKSLDKSLADMAEDKDTLATQQAAVLEYWGKITDRCVAKPELYEERRARREKEIAGLKEALSLLDSATASLLEVAHTHEVRSPARSTMAFLGTNQE